MRTLGWKQFRSDDDLPPDQFHTRGCHFYRLLPHEWRGSASDAATVTGETNPFKVRKVTDKQHIKSPIAEHENVPMAEKNVGYRVPNTQQVIWQ